MMNNESFPKLIGFMDFFLQNSMVLSHLWSLVEYPLVQNMAHKFLRVTGWNDSPERSLRLVKIDSKITFSSVWRKTPVCCSPQGTTWSSSPPGISTCSRFPLLFNISSLLEISPILLFNILLSRGHELLSGHRPLSQPTKPTGDLSPPAFQTDALFKNILYQLHTYIKMGQNISEIISDSKRILCQNKKEKL